MSDQPNDQRDPEPRNALTENATETPQPVESQQVDLAQQGERDPVADLAICNAATPGPWESVSGYSVREAEDERGYGAIIGRMDCKEHSIEQMVYNACFVCESREALPYYIQAYLAERAEVERLKAEANALDRLRAWRDLANSPGRWFNLENDIGAPDCLALGELPDALHLPSRLIVVSSDDEPHTEDNPASFAEMVDAALKRWEELYPN